VLRTGVAITIFMAWAGVSRTASAQEEPPRPEEGAVPSTPSEPNATPAPPPARADEVAACVKSAENAQTERSAHRLRAARERLLACAQASCPSVVRNDCATWLSEVDQLLPSVVVQARDTRGLELFDVSDAEILGRLAKRRTLEHRADDDPKAVATRLEAYRAQTAPVLDWYRQNGALHTIQAVGSVQEIADRVREVLGK